MTRPAVLLLTGAAALIALGAIAVLALSHHDPECVWPAEAARPLDLNVSADREHLLRDVGRLRQVAAGFGDAVAKRPLLSDSPDAIEGARTAPGRARSWCEAVLSDAVARSHHLDRDEVRRAQP